MILADDLLPVAQDTHAFAPFVRALGRGPTKSRSLTRAEADQALSLALTGQATAEQIGAFLVLLRYRGEHPAEMAGFVDAVRRVSHVPLAVGPVDLDWPSYADGTKRATGLFVQSAARLAREGVRILMHGPADAVGRSVVRSALAAQDIALVADAAGAKAALDRNGIAYLAMDQACPAFHQMLSLRGVLGLRTPLNTVGRLLNPADAPASIDGVFHPPYIKLHLEVAKLLGRQRLTVLKGGGGEAEANPQKSTSLHHLLPDGSNSEGLLPAILGRDADEAAIAEATIIATMQAARCALG